MYGDRFGQWSTFDRNAVHRNDACGAPRGLLILESQQTLMKFLRVLTTVVLNGVKPSKPSNSPVTISSTDTDTRSADAQYLKVCTVAGTLYSRAIRRALILKPARIQSSSPAPVYDTYTNSSKSIEIFNQVLRPNV